MVEVTNGESGDDPKPELSKIDNKDLGPFEDTSFESFEKKYKGLIMYSYYDEVKLLLKCPEFSETFIEKSYEILNLAVDQFMLDDEDEKSQKCFELTLDTLTSYAQPREFVLFLSEQIVLCKSHICFRYLLKSLKDCLCNCSDIHLTIGTATNSIKEYLFKPLGSEKNVCLDLKEHEIAEFSQIYMDITHFANELHKDSLYILEGKTQKAVDTVHHTLLELLITLFGVPLGNSKNLPIYRQVFDILLNMQPDLVYLMKFYNCEMMYERTDHIFMDTERYSYTNFYYMALCEFDYFVPLVYDSVYVAINVIHLGNLLMQQSYVDKFRVEKSLSLYNWVIQKYPKVKMSFECLDLRIHQDLFCGVSECMQYCESLEVRKSALKVFTSSLDLYDTKALYRVLTKLFGVIYHSGVRGVIVGYIKQILASLLQKEESKDFFGTNLKKLLLTICGGKIEHCSELLNKSDEAMSILNLILFLIIRDKNNISGIKDCIDDVKNVFLKPVQKSIEEGKKYWADKAKNLNDGFAVNPEFSNDLEMVTGGDSEVLLTEQKIDACHKAYNVFLMLDMTMQSIKENIDL